MGNIIKYKAVLVLLFTCLLLSSCTKDSEVINSKLEQSFSVIADLCYKSFAPKSQDEFEGAYEKYKNTFITEGVLAEFMGTDKKLHYNVSISNYKSYYTLNAIGDRTRYVSTFRLTNGTVYSDMRVEFMVEDGKVVDTKIITLSE